MYRIIISVLLLAIFSGCTEKRLILVPSNTYYPKFPTEDFRNFDKLPIKTSVKVTQENDIDVTYIITEESEFMKLIEYTKNLRSEHNVLLNSLIKFNDRIEELNAFQNAKKPQEIRKIPDEYLK